jgi:putative cardiolipin synthase
MRARRAPAAFVWLILVLLAAGCATIPGADYPRQASIALSQPTETQFGRTVAALAAAHPETSGFKLLPRGADGYALRAQMADAAERTLDVQYYVIENDDSGYLLMDALLRAAKRGVRVRLLIDDPQARGQEPEIAALAAHPNIEVRLYNPFAYRGDIPAFRWMELALSAKRLNHRMHNKLYVADNAIALTGGRNVGDAYFESGKDLQFGDYDVFAMGPVARRLSQSFDEYWNSTWTVPVQALFGAKPGAEDIAKFERDLAEHREAMRDSELSRKAATGKPLAGMLVANGVVWAKADVIYDSPDKADVEDGDAPGVLLRRRLIAASKEVQNELIIVSPYFVPGKPGEAMLKALAERGVRVRVLTNSLASTDEPIVHAGYQHYRVPLLEDGVELYEVKPLPGNPQPRGGALDAPSAGQFALHAKVFVFDRKKLFVGSANFDRRSFHLNTEVGLLIESHELARQVVERFDVITQPANSYIVTLADGNHPLRRLAWRSEENGREVVTNAEPGNNRVRDFETDLLSLLPLDNLL